MSSFGPDSAGVEKRCVVCESPTQSHAVPNGYLCHSCLTERDEREIFDQLIGGFEPGVTAESHVKCRDCGSVHTTREAAAGPGDFARVIVGRVPFDSLRAELVLSCPRCTSATEYLISEAAGEAVAEETGAKVYDFTAGRRVVER